MLGILFTTCSFFVLIAADKTMPTENGVVSVIESTSVANSLQNLSLPIATESPIKLNLIQLKSSDETYGFSGALAVVGVVAGVVGVAAALVGAGVVCRRRRGANLNLYRNLGSPSAARDGGPLPPEPDMFGCEDRYLLESRVC